tara:strand:+ start:34 stop:324 length:291 start_codon:yes stop_codon:yes gene_type:complete
MVISKIIILSILTLVAVKIYQDKRKEEKESILKGIINGVPLEKGQRFEFLPYEDNKIYTVDDIDFEEHVVWLKDNTNETTELHFLDFAKYYLVYID